MSFTPEQEQLLNQKFSDLTAQLDKTVSGLAARLVQSEIPKIISSQLQPIQEKIDGLNEDTFGNIVESRFDALLERLAAEDSSKSDTTETDRPTLPENLEELPAFIAIRQQLADVQSIAEQERAERERLAEAARVGRLDGELIDQLRGKVITGTEKQLVTLLKSGVLQESEDKSAYVVPIKDQYGLEVKKPLGEVLPSMLEKDWQHFLAPRAGTGTGGSPSTGGYSSQPNYQYLKPTNGGVTVDDDVFMKAANDPNVMQALMNELSAS